MSVPKVMMGGLTHGSPRMEYVGSVMRLKDYEMSKPAELRHYHSYHVKIGPYISRNRNYLTRLFRERTEADWLLMVDHDVVVPKTLMEDLVREAGDEAGVVVADHVLGTSCPTTALMNSDDPTIFIAARPPGAGTTKHFVETAASSVIMIHRRVVEAVAKKFGNGFWWIQERVQDPKDGYWDELGEDFSFSKRALAVGERIMAVYGLDVQHYKVGLVMAPPAKAGGK